ncbi:MAG: TonB-dependent receptor [Bacteroidetes bacterium]|nr:TonB-dependent receptor [Bacteroidota bacterium]MBS1607902.1 TonB-dependent receptor [Bacteroidota bacterium]
MKKFILIVLTTLTAFSGFSQMPAGGGQQANIGHLYGKVVDSSDKAIGDVSVLILQNKFDAKTKKNKEVLLKGMTTKNNGEFSFDALPMFGKLKLKISATGYVPYEQEVSFQMNMGGGGGGARPGGDPSQQMANMSKALNAIDKDLGNIKLQNDVKQLQGVVVTASKPLLTMDIDKKTFNVDKNIVTAGGTAVDVMRNVPSVQVDIDGNVKLRNAAPQIYIDGRPTTLSLDQIPADAIESVEVITNPSAKYDASGGNAGILNIVLKKNKKTGYNGNVMAGIDRRGGWNGGGNFNLRQDKFNFSAALMTNQMRNRTTGTTNRYDEGDTAVNIRQDNLNKTKGGFLFGKIGLDYFLTNRTTISGGVIKVHGKFRPNENIDINTDSLFNNGSKASLYSNRLSNSTREFNATGFQLGMKHNFAKAGEEWTADMNVFKGKNEGDALYTTNYYNNSGNSTGTQLQKNISNGTNRFTTIQTDYVNPFTETTKLEAGLRAQITSIENNNLNSIQYPGTGIFKEIPSATTNYKNTNNVYAAYISIASTIKKNFGYKIGVRAESSNYEGNLLNTGEKFSNSYPVSLFPSLFLSQKLKKNQELQFSVTRRINRPNFFQLIPYTDYTDSLNITRGNPNLVPEFTSSAELSYSKTFKANNTFLASVYYKHTNNLITRYLDTSYNAVAGKTDYISTFVNANSSYSYGLELTSINTLKKWWDVTTNINFYNSKINTDNISGSSQDALWSVFGKLNNNFKLPKNYTIQLSVDYQSKTNLPINNSQGFGPPMSQAQSSSQGYIRPFYGVDVAFKKTFLKNQAASVTLSFNDIFATRKNDQHSEGIGFVQDYYRLNNPQMIRLNFTYRFGKIDMSLFKRQNLKAQGEGMSNGMQGMQQ